MAIETLQSGLWTPQLAPEPQRVLPFRKGTPDVAEATGVTMDMLAYLGALTDANREATETAVRDSFATDAALGLEDVSLCDCQHRVHRLRRCLPLPRAESPKM